MGLFRKRQNSTAIRTVELSQPLSTLTDILDYTGVRIFATWQGRILGSFEIANQRQPVSVSRLRQAIADNLALKALALDHDRGDGARWAELIAALAERYKPHEENEKPFAGRLVELSQPLHPVTDVLEYSQVQIIVAWQSQLIGTVEIVNQHQPISITRLREAIVDCLGLQLLELGGHFSRGTLWATAVEILAQHYQDRHGNGTAITEKLPAHVPVSIVVATLDRPEDLRNCLIHLVAQASPRPIEIIVVDNNPASGLIPPVVAEFPSVILVNERRRGLAYARNAGFVASTGDIVIATDDDVIVPPDWLERLVAPFARSDVMIVTGNVLPFELETPAQHFFELYGGLGRGFRRFEVNADWFEAFRFRAVPTWELGATANAAFRAQIFTHPKIGLMDETLGPGMPSGVGEDTYLFYKVLKAGYTIAYEPEAYVWHKHRRTMAALRRQLYNYSKGGIAYNLTTLFKDGDLRGLIRIVAELPMIYRWRINEWVHGRNDYPMSLLMLEALGNLAGFWALWQSWQRVKRAGRSGPYVPVSQRSELTPYVPLVEELVKAYPDAASYALPQ